MKKIMLLKLIMGLVFFSTLAQTADEKAIKRVITDEVNTFYANDYENWVESFTKTPEFQRVLVSENGETVTWDWKQFNKYIKKNIDQEFPNHSSTMANYQAHVMGNLAVVSLISTSDWGEGTLVRPKIYVLERIGDEWKISYYRSGLMENSTIPDVP